ncbi:hypothetical protein ACWOAH_06040 [Vagococcus vulneris]|uniref:Uncharacterized protein n=1 Tax=Vagococcus vulneris TaxID=1977869 RepID=A0A429ZZ42_9ENTE|nr:hypothetical protein [Vagococcus vulneris]RST99275.1 hypothetical protein CBF37_04715 [Vagococcus vulneris]
MKRTKKKYFIMFLFVLIIAGECFYMFQVNLTYKQIVKSDNQVKKVKADLDEANRLKDEYTNTKKLEKMQRDTDSFTKDIDIYDLADKKADAQLSPYTKAIDSYKEPAKSKDLKTQINTFNSLIQLTPPYTSKSEARDTLYNSAKGEID